MLERLESKATQFLEGILAKDNISVEDYQVIVAEIYRLKTEEKQKELDEANKKQRDAIKTQMLSLFD